MEQRTGVNRPERALGADTVPRREQKREQGRCIFRTRMIRHYKEDRVWHIQH